MVAFEDDIETWKTDPVVRAVSYKYRAFGAFPINFNFHEHFEIKNLKKL